MTYTSRFQNDIFISYAHVDNQVVEGGGQGWVDLFTRHLDLELSQLAGEMHAVGIWRDRNLTGNQYFHDKNREIVEKSAVLIAITSPGYLNSKYGQQELHYFNEAAASDLIGTSVGNRSRIFNVLIYDVPPASWPKEYGNTTGFSFFDRETDRPGIGHPADPESMVFHRRLRELAAEILSVLNLLNETLENQNPKPSTDNPPDPVPHVASTEDVVFVCYDREDEKFSLALATKIKEQGISVWVDQWNINASDDWDLSIDDALHSCARFLIVLSPSSVKSDEVRGELRFALDEKKPIVPVLHRDCIIPRRLRLTQRVDFRSRSLDDQAEMGELLKALRARRK